MSTPAAPLINGNYYYFGSIELVVAGTRYLGSTEVNYDTDLEPGKVYGTTASKIGRTRGKHDATGSLKVHKVVFDDLTKRLGVGFMEKAFLTVVSYAEDAGSNTITDNLYGARITKVSHANATGPDPTLVTLNLDIMYIEYNGTPAVTPIPTTGLGAQ